METKSLILIDWNVRGVSEPIRMLLSYLHLSYTEIKLEPDNQKPFEAATKLCDELKKKMDIELSSLPHLLDIDNNLSLGSSLCICKYIAQKYNPKMAGSGMNEIAEIDSLLFIIHDIRNTIIDALETNWEKNKQNVNGLMAEKLGFINKFMRSKTWLSGKQVSIADFALCELLELISFLDSNLIASYPHIIKLQRKFNAIPEISKFKESQETFDIKKYLISSYAER